VSSDPEPYSLFPRALTIPTHCEIQNKVNNSVENIGNFLYVLEYKFP
jgi:hypothetical protein